MGENSSDISYQKVLHYSLLQHSKVIALDVLQNDGRETFSKTYYPMLFSCEQKSMFSCWAVSTKPIAVKYVKKYESFQETSLISFSERELYVL